MLTILATISPVFLLVGIGAAAVHTGLLPRVSMPHFGQFVFNFAMPCLLFHAVSHQAIGQVVSLRYLLAYAGASLLMMGIGLCTMRYVFHRPGAESGLFGLGSCMGNCAFIGYAVATFVYGAHAVGPIAMTLTVENGLLLPVALAIAELEIGHHPHLGGLLAQTALRLARHPLILAIAAGMVFSIAHLSLPAVPEKVVSMLGNAAAPVALVMVGGTLVGVELHGIVTDIVLMAVSKLLLHPVLILGMMLLFHPRPELATAGCIMAASPTAGMLPVITQRYGYRETAAAAVVASTGVSFLTISLMVWLMAHFGAAIFGA